MKKIDWARHFHYFKSDAEERKIKKLLNQLWKLSSNDYKAGTEIMKKLIFKHFPQGQYNEHHRAHYTVYENCAWTIHDFNNWNIQSCF